MPVAPYYNAQTPSAYIGAKPPSDAARQPLAEVLNFAGKGKQNFNTTGYRYSPCRNGALRLSGVRDFGYSTGFCGCLCLQRLSCGVLRKMAGIPP